MAKQCRITVVSISIDPSRCSKCGDCINYCPVGVFSRSVDGLPSPSGLDKCIACIGCMALCDSGAVSVVTDWVCGAEGEEA